MNFSRQGLLFLILAVVVIGGGIFLLKGDSNPAADIPENNIPVSNAENNGSQNNQSEKSDENNGNSAADGTNGDIVSLAGDYSPEDLQDLNEIPAQTNPDPSAVSASTSVVPIQDITPANPVIATLGQISDGFSGTLVPSGAVMFMGSNANQSTDNTDNQNQTNATSTQNSTSTAPTATSTTPSPTSTPVLPNLIVNGDLEIIDPDKADMPLGWNAGSWLDNTAIFTYPAPEVENSKAVKVEITGWTSGDAKWYFNHVPVSTGAVLSYSEKYMSDVSSNITVEFLNLDGTYKYAGIALPPAANTLTPLSFDIAVPAGVKSLTIFHSITEIGSLTIDDVELKQKAAPVAKTDVSNIFSSGAVSLTFDDGWISQYDAAIPALNSAGYKGTFYITTRQLADNGFANFMSKSQVQSLYADGYEIGSHTKTHGHLTQLTIAQKTDEILGSKQDLADMGINSASFDYPYGEFDSEILQMVKDNFSAAVSAVSENAIQISDRYQLPRLTINASTTMDQVKEIIDSAVDNQQWAILSFHRIDDSSDPYRITPNLFTDIIDYLKQQSVKVVTISEGIKSLASQ